MGISAAIVAMGTLGAIASGCGTSDNGTTSNGDAGKGSDANNPSGNDAQPIITFDSGALGDDDTGSDSAIVSGDDDSGLVTGDDDSGSSDSGGDDGGSGSGDSGKDSGAGLDSGSDAAVDAGCKPSSLHVPIPDGGVYCPYSFNDAIDAGIQYCANGTQQCCLSPGADAGPSICQAFDGTGVAFNGGKGGCGAQYLGAWQCSSPADCETAGPQLPIDGGAPTSGALVCCLAGGALQSESATCSTVQKTHFGGTSCQPASACTGTITIGTFVDPLYIACEQQSDCPLVTQTCTPIFTTGTPIGVCLPQQ